MSIVKTKGSGEPPRQVRVLGGLQPEGTRVHHSGSMRPFRSPEFLREVKVKINERHKNERDMPGLSSRKSGEETHSKSALPKVRNNSSKGASAIRKMRASLHDPCRANRLKISMPLNSSNCAMHDAQGVVKDGVRDDARRCATMLANCVALWIIQESGVRLF